MNALRLQRRNWKDYLSDRTNNTTLPRMSRESILNGALTRTRTHPCGNPIRRHFDERIIRSIINVVSTLAYGLLETGHKEELRSCLVTRPRGLREGTRQPEGGVEGEFCGRDLGSVAALVCPYGLGRSKTSAPRQLAGMDDFDPDQNEP